VIARIWPIFEPQAARFPSVVHPGQLTLIGRDAGLEAHPLPDWHNQENPSCVIVISIGKLDNQAPGSITSRFIGVFACN